MSSVRPDRRCRPLLVGLLLAMLVGSTAACDLLPGGGGGGGEEGDVAVQQSVSHGPCLPTIANGVKSVAMSSDGQLLMYLSDVRPANWPENQYWTDTDRAVYVVRQGESAEGEVISATHAIVMAPMSDTLKAQGMDDYGRPVTAEPAVLPEQMEDLELAATGDRFVLAVSRKGVTGNLAKLYTGIVPQDNAVLDLGDGTLSLVPINDFAATEGLRSFLLSPDGSKLVALVGSQGELRVFDFAANHPIIFTLDDGEVTTSNALPAPAVSIAVKRQPAFAFPGTIRMAWSPTSDKLAIGTTDRVGVNAVWILDVATGARSLVRSFRDTTVPYAVWSTDGGSLFVFTTRLSAAAGSTFGDSEVRRIAARESGEDIGDRWQLAQQEWYRTAPADFTAYGDDSRFLFTWEKQLWLLETPASGKGAASYGPLTLEPPKMSVVTGNLSGKIAVSSSADTAAFLVADTIGEHLGQRLFVSQEKCPLVPEVAPLEPAEDAGAAPTVEGGVVPTAANAVAPTAVP